MFNRPYLPPSFDNLCERVDEVAKYGEGPRKPLVNLLKSFRAFAKAMNKGKVESSDLEELSDFEDSFDEDDDRPGQSNQQADSAEVRAHKILLGGWVACLEDIQSDYKTISPDVLTLFGCKVKGSDLFTKLKTNLNISSQNQLDDKSRLIYLSILYNSLFDESALDHDTIVQLFSDNNIDLNLVKNEIKLSTTIILNRMGTDIVHLLEAVPLEEAIANKTDFIDITYREAKSGNTEQYIAVNEEREFAYQFLTALSHLIPEFVPEEKKTSAEEISRPQRIRMGAVLYVMHTINSEYYIRSPSNSKLYKICAELLNITHHDKIDFKTRNACFEAFQSLLSDNRLLSAIEKYGREHYRDHNLLMHIDGRIHSISKKLEEMLKTQPTSSWPMTNLLSYLGGLLLMAPGYGLGILVGDIASETESMVQPKLLASRGINHVGKVVLGTAGGTLGFLAADFVFRSALERLFAKVLEQGGYILGYTVGGSVGLCIDLSYKGLKNLCMYLLNKLDTISDPTLLKNIDREFLECLLNLPDDVFSYEEQEHLKDITGKTPSRLEITPEKCDEESETYTYTSFYHQP